jgi:hypothetical protein
MGGAVIRERKERETNDEASGSPDVRSVHVCTLKTEPQSGPRRLRYASRQKSAEVYFCARDFNPKG